MRRSSVVTKSVKKRKNSINFKNLFFWLVILFIASYIGYFLFTFFSVKTFNPLLSGSLERYLLSKESDDMEKTLIILEEGYDNNRRISDVYLVLSNSQKKISIVVYIPGDIHFEALKEDFGSSITVSSLRYAGDFLQEGRGVEYAVWQLSQMLGIKVNNYILVSSEARDTLNNISGNSGGMQESFKEYYSVDDGSQIGESFFKLHNISSSQSYMKIFFSPSEFKKLDQNIYSNLSFTKAFGKISGYSGTVKGTQTYAIDLSYYKYLTESMSEQGGQVTSLNTESFDTTFRNLYAKVIDRDLEEESVRVEVYNGSGISGSAFQLGRKIENTGCDVVRYGNAPKNIEKTIVYVPQKELFANSYKVVEEVLSGTFELVEGRPEFMTTGDIVIVLGEDIKLMYRF
ncbi:LytR C-terminal domain-containing protein [Candidatus Microgenomates bacterium]|jgi:hypothetical protein|nr:LytR C-terminal domain-containing protein [Candidatus Microgenomates bacterium]